MQRRKFLVGMGSLAAGSAAAMGTGAFAATNFDRTLNVQIAGDTNAYLGLESTSEYASQDGNQIVLEFDGSNNQNGNGLNENSDTEFRNVFKVKNNGTNDLRVQFFTGGDGSFNGDLTGTPLAVAVSDDEIFYSSINDIEAVNTSDSPANWPGGAPAVASAQDIPSGQESYVHLGFFLNDETEALGHSNTSIGDVPDALEIYAEALPETGAL